MPVTWPVNGGPAEPRGYEPVSGATTSAVYHGPPDLTLVRVFTEWTLDPVIAVLVVGLGAWYVLAMRRVRASGGEWPISRAVNFLGLGLGSAVLVTMSFVGVYDDTLFWVRALQVITLLAISPMFLANGAPFTLLLAALPEARRERAERVLRGRFARLLTFPPVGTVLLVLTPWVLYFTPLYDLLLRHAAVDALVEVAVLTIGFLYFWARLQADPMPREYPHLVSVGITFAEAIFDGALGLTLIFMTHPIAGSYYASLHRSWGPSVRMDHIIGGGVLWMTGDLAGLPFLGALFVRMFRQDQREAVTIDRELDVQAAQEHAAAGGAAGEPELMRPWWETDPVLSKRYGTGGSRRDGG
jgi:cytochrome c oxidase assembly factor CtaG